MLIKRIYGKGVKIMTAKRFTTKNIICSNYCVWDNNDKPYGNDEVVELLNELHEENKGIQDKIFKLLDWLETEKGVSRKEIKEWWND